MKRNLEICRRCGKMELCLQNYGKDVYICENTFKSFGFGGFLMSEIPLDENEWIEEDIPFECDLYAEYFLMECNE